MKDWPLQLLALACWAQNCAASSNTCFLVRPGSSDRANTSLRVVRRSWLSHEIASVLTEIVLKEFLGFSVEHQTDGIIAHSGQDWGLEMSSGAMDIDVEQWNAHVQSPSYQQYILSEQSVSDVGSIGYAGRSGLFTLESVLEREDKADYYQFFRARNASEGFQAQALFRTFADSQLESFLGSSFPACNASAFSWCGVGELEGYWAAPACSDGLDDCVEVFHTLPDSDTGYFEQLARNHHLALVFGYYGADMPTHLRALAAGPKAIMFYWWEPHPLLAEVKAVRVSFPDFQYGCDRGDTQNPNTGLVGCDHTWLPLRKLVSSHVRHIAPEAFLFLSNLEVFQDEMGDLIRLASSVSPAHDVEDIYAVACNHIKQHIDTFSRFAPTCITHPPDPVSDGDLIFNPTTLQCESAVVYGTVPETRCFGDSDRPGSVDRSDHTIKIVRRGWTTHDMASMLAEVLLREYLGYTVQLVYNGRTADYYFGNEMVDGHYDFDVEQWNALPGSENEMQFLRTGQLLSLGILGYSGRAGIYVSSDTISNNPGLMLDYYKGYRNATAAAAAGLVTHAESPLRDVLGEDFPLPCPHVCGTGDLEGYWAPQVCLDNPGRCIEFINFAPSWDIAYGEQLINNLGLEAVMAYYGYDGMFKVIESLAGTGRAIPFIWFEPDEFLLKQGATRISFPDFAYGCDRNSTSNPNTGGISCDWVPSDLYKITAPRVRTGMPEAYVVLSRIEIYIEMMNGLMAEEGSYSERVCKFIRTNPDKVSEWAPDCLTQPLTPDQVRGNDTVFFPALLECKPITCPSDRIIRYEELFATFYCDECGNGEIPDADQVQCSLCPLGQELDESTRQCRPCMPGSTIASEGYCSSCPPGWFSAGGVSAECEPCQAGFTSAEAASSCLPCPRGAFSGVGAGNCTPCDAGRFAATFNSTECAVCEIGRYASSPASSQCVQCGESFSSPEHFVTMAKLEFLGETQYNYVLGSDSAEHCGCDRGRRWDGFGECVACAEGMQCLGLGDVVILPGYYSKAAPDISVFRCHGDSGRCTGGVPGETCAKGRKGIACAECEEDMVVEGNICVPCSDQDMIPILMFGVIAFVALVLIDIFAADGVGTNKSLSAVFCVIALGQLVTALQVMSIVSLLSLAWEEPFKTLLKATTVIALDFEVLRVGCISTLTSLEKYMGKLLLLLMGLCLLCAIHMVKLAILRFRGITMKNRFWSLVAALSALLMLFYIPVASAVLQPLQCKRHPNGLWTVWAYQSVVCWESSEHIAMMVISIVVFILVPLGFLAFVVIVLMQVTSRIQRVDAKFVRTFSFLFFRFKPGLHWFAVVLMSKNLLLAICIVIPDALFQIIFLVIVNLAFWGLVLRLEPWRMLRAQVLDVSLTLAMLLVIVIAACYVEDEEKDFHALSWICFVMVVSVVGAALLALVYNVFKRIAWQKKRFEFFLCHHKAASGAFTRLLQMNLLDSPRTTRDVFIDSDHLDNLDHLFEYVRSDTKTFVMIATTDLFSRPWCVGEMTTAMLAKVASVIVSLPGGFVPDEIFIHTLADTGLPNSEVLTEAGLDMVVICKALAWTQSLLVFAIGRKISSKKMNQLTDMLQLHSLTEAASKQTLSRMNSSLSGELPSSESVNASSALVLNESSASREVYLAYDTDNIDACAACHVLQRMMVPLANYAAEFIPHILEHVRLMPSRSATAIVMCTNGIFENPACAKILAKSLVNKHVPYPVLAEPTFRFPPADVQTWLGQMHASKCQSQEIHDASNCIVLLFKEIATHFEPNTASLSVLEVSAREVFRRIVALKKRASTSHNHNSSSKISNTWVLAADDPAPGDLHVRSPIPSVMSSAGAEEDGHPQGIQVGSQPLDELLDDDDSVVSCL